MSDMRRRDFLTTIPAAGLGAFVGNKEESASTTEIMQPTAPTYYALSSRKGGFVLKIQGLNLVRVEQSTTNGVAKDASIYCLDVGKSVGAGSAHYPTLIVPKACVAKPSKAPDTVMGEFALYKLAGNVTLTVPKPGAPTFTEGAVKSACGSLPAGLGSFLQVRAGLKREFAEHGGAATPAELEKRSIAWMTLSGGGWSTPPILILAIQPTSRFWSGAASTPKRSAKSSTTAHRTRERSLSGFQARTSCSIVQVLRSWLGWPTCLCTR